MAKYPFSIRPAEITDLKVLAQIAESTFRIAFEADNDPIDFEEYIQTTFNLPKVEAELEDSANLYFLLETDGEVNGYLKLRKGKIPECLAGNHLIELERIYISPKVQNQGLGKELFDFAVNLAKNKGFEMIWLGVWAKNDGAVRFYQRMGMQKYGSHIFELGKDKQTDWVMAMNI